MKILKKIKKLLKHLKLALSNFFKQKEYEKANFDSPSKWIERIFKEEVISIVQVGSNDGMQGDPLYELIQKNKNWIALFIEPVPYLYERLKINYQSQSRFKFENLAINDGSRQTFYSVKDTANLEIRGLPKWYDQLGSFDKKNVTKHLNGVLEPYIIETKIKGATLSAVLTNNQVTSIDLLHIDVEGYDWKVLSQLDMTLYLPRVILFEHKHLEEAEKKQALKHLKQNGFTVYNLGCDFICVRKESKEIIKGLTGEKIT